MKREGLVSATLTAVFLCCVSSFTFAADTAGQSGKGEGEIATWIALLAAAGSGLFGAVIGFIASTWIANKQLRINAIRERRNELNGLYVKILDGGLEAMRNCYSPERAKAVDEYLQLRRSNYPPHQQRCAQIINEHPDMPKLAETLEELYRMVMEHQAYMDLIVDDKETKELFESYKKAVYLDMGEVEKTDYFPRAEDLHEKLVAAMRKSRDGAMLKKWYKREID